MNRGIYATLEHRKLMELKNCGAAVDEELMDIEASLRYARLRKKIIETRLLHRGNQSWLERLMDFSLPVEKEVEIMFGTKEDLADHLKDIVVPSGLCPITTEEKDDFLFFMRAARYSKEARKVLDMFKRHHEVVVDADRSLIVEWVLQNAQKIREEV